MSQIGYPSSYEYCATCSYWGGKRQPDSPKTRVIVDSSSAKGKCLLQSGPNKGQDMSMEKKCGKWEKWKALKLV